MEVPDVLLLAMLGLASLHLLFHIPHRSIRKAWGEVCSARGRDANEVNAHIERHFQRKRLDSTLFLLNASSYFNGLGLMWAVINASLYRRASHYEAEYQTEYLRRHFVFFVVIGVCTSPSIRRLADKALRCCSANCLPSSFGAAGTASKLDLLYSLGMCCCIVLVMSTPECVWWDRQMAMIRMAASVVNRNTSMSVLWNVLYLACKIGRAEILRLVAPQLSIPDCYFAEPRDSLNVYWDDVFEFSMILTVTWTVEQLGRDEAIGATTARAQSNTREALSSILNASCDAVLTLNNDLVVLGHTPKLAAMLLRQDSSVDGMSLQSLFPQDGDDVVRKLNENCDDSLAMAFHANMQDTAGNAVPIHGFHTRFTELDGSVSHIIGLSEAGDPQEGRTRLRPSPIAPLRPEAEARPSQRRRGIPRSGRGTPSVSDSGSNEIRSLGSLGSRKSDNNRNNIKTLVCPDKQATQKVAKEFTVLSLLERWNILVSQRDCCTYHVALRELLSVASQMRSIPCFPLNMETVREQDQCVECGLMACELRRNGRCCTVCEEWFAGMNSSPMPSSSSRLGATRSENSNSGRLSLERPTLEHL